MEQVFLALLRLVALAEICAKRKYLRNSDKLFAQPIRKPAYLWMMTSRRAFDDDICKSQPVSFLLEIFGGLFACGIWQFFGRNVPKEIVHNQFAGNGFFRTGAYRFQTTGFRRWWPAAATVTWYVFSESRVPKCDRGISYRKGFAIKFWQLKPLGISFSLQNYSSLLLYLLKIPKGVGPNKKSLIQGSLFRRGPQSKPASVSLSSWCLFMSYVKITSTVLSQLSG